MNTIQPVFPYSAPLPGFAASTSLIAEEPSSPHICFSRKQNAQFFCRFFCPQSDPMYLFTICVYLQLQLSTPQTLGFSLKIKLFTELSTLSTKKLCTPSRGYFMSITNVRFVHIHEIDFSAKKYCYSIDKSPVRKTT